MTRKTEGALTELESCVLGAIWNRGPCSAYAIRREFAESASSYWSSSAGSIYPVIRRLRAEGLVTGKADPADGRGTHDIVATPKGKRVLRRWVSELPDWTGKASLDPIRTRMNFVLVLKSSRERLAFIARAATNTRAQVAVLEKMQKSEVRPDIERLLTLGSLYELKGRLAWLDAVRKELGRRRPVKSGRAR